MADFVRDLGEISLDRIRFEPPPGTATIRDVERSKLCELIDGTLVEKAMGMREAMLALYLARLIDDFVRPRNLGILVGADATMEILTGLVRLPDVAFVSWDRFPGRKIPEVAVPSVAPDLAVEVISQGNTKNEMARKRGEYFRAGVRLVWEIDHRKQSVTVYTSESEPRSLTPDDTLDGGDVLPGFTVPVRQLFSELDRHG